MPIIYSAITYSWKKKRNILYTYFYSDYYCFDNWILMSMFINYHMFLFQHNSQHNIKYKFIFNTTENTIDYRNEWQANNGQQHVEQHRKQHALYEYFKQPTTNTTQSENKLKAESERKKERNVKEMPQIFILLIADFLPRWEIESPKPVQHERMLIFMSNLLILWLELCLEAYTVCQTDKQTNMSRYRQIIIANNLMLY